MWQMALHKYQAELSKPQYVFQSAILLNTTLLELQNRGNIFFQLSCIIFQSRTENDLSCVKSIQKLVFNCMLDTKEFSASMLDVTIHFLLNSSQLEQGSRMINNDIKRMDIIYLCFGELNLHRILIILLLESVYHQMFMYLFLFIYLLSFDMVPHSVALADLRAFLQPRVVLNSQPSSFLGPSYAKFINTSQSTRLCFHFTHILKGFLIVLWKLLLIFFFPPMATIYWV